MKQTDVLSKSFLLSCLDTDGLLFVFGFTSKWTKLFLLPRSEVQCNLLGLICLISLITLLAKVCLSMWWFIINSRTYSTTIEWSVFAPYEQMTHLDQGKALGLDSHIVAITCLPSLIQSMHRERLSSVNLPFTGEQSKRLDMWGSTRAPAHAVGVMWAHWCSTKRAVWCGTFYTFFKSVFDFHLQMFPHE